MARISTLSACLFLMLIAFLSSCQKDEELKTVPSKSAYADSTQRTATGNFLASKGTLKVKIQDSTYTFDAAQDSIAFVNINIDGKEYYGLTAINKTHTVSFGISTSGAPIAEMPGVVAGCQFLTNNAGKKNIAYTLTRNATTQDYGILSLDKYYQDTVLAKGIFHTYLARDTQKTSPFYVAEGSFELKVK
jgi:hypothetical protein